MITVTVPPGHADGVLQFAFPSVSVAMIRYWEIPVVGNGPNDVDDDPGSIDPHIANGSLPRR